MQVGWREFHEHMIPAHLLQHPQTTPSLQVPVEALLSGLEILLVEGMELFGISRHNLRVALHPPGDEPRAALLGSDSDEHPGVEAVAVDCLGWWRAGLAPC